MEDPRNTPVQHKRPDDGVERPNKHEKPRAEHDGRTRNAPEWNASENGRKKEYQLRDHPERIGKATANKPNACQDRTRK
jgi:hypothetical protein